MITTPHGAMQYQRAPGSSHTLLLHRGQRVTGQVLHRKVFPPGAEVLSVHTCLKCRHTVPVPGPGPGFRSQQLWVQRGCQFSRQNETHRPLQHRRRHRRRQQQQQQAPIGTSLLCHQLQAMEDGHRQGVQQLLLVQQRRHKILRVQQRPNHRRRPHRRLSHHHRRRNK